MRSVIIICLLLALAMPAWGHGYIDSPMDLSIYDACPQPILFTSQIGAVTGTLAGGAIGGVIGILFVPFDGLQAIEIGAFGGAYVGSLTLGSITGAPAYGVYRLFNWNGCGPSKED